ncbi:hypothetical protein ILUMI_20891 [Ignelater luminosus]|uniref:Uncharacterized protein n=1 Tax=Ignelater luminosus TaxID=2038154 RepID=A0A8K0G4F1_IGNLU|nr:hypothetical protein ILUMI_20891 [Ignelater luminosus]
MICLRLIRDTTELWSELRSTPGFFLQLTVNDDKVDLISSYSLVAMLWRCPSISLRGGSAKQMRANPGLRISEYEIAGLVVSALKRFFRTYIAVNGFRCIGIHSSNRNVFDDLDFLLSARTDIEENTPPSKTDFIESQPSIHFLNFSYICTFRKTRLSKGFPKDPRDDLKRKNSITKKSNNALIENKSFQISLEVFRTLNENFTENWTIAPDIISALSNALLSSIDERSFSAYGLILSDEDTFFLVVNVEKYFDGNNPIK